MNTNHWGGTSRVIAAIRLIVIALMLGATLLALPASTSARNTGLAGYFAQGSSQDVDPVNAAKTPESEDEDEDEGKETPEDDDDDDNTSKKKTPKADDLPEEWVDAGLVSETEYESPQFGYTVEWDTTWVLDEWYDDPQNGNGTVVTEDEETGADDLYIWVEDNDSILHVQGIANENELTGEDYLDYWQSDDYLEGFRSPAEMLAIEGDKDAVGFIYSLDSDDGMFIGYNQVIVADQGETLIFLFFLAPVDSFEEGYGQAQEGVQVDGDEVFNIISNRDLEDVIEEIEVFI